MRRDHGGFNEKELGLADTTQADIRDVGQEKEFEVEITKEDIKGIEDQMERERAREGLKGGQSLAFEGAALARLGKIAPEAVIKKVEFTDDDIKKCKERIAEDIAGAVSAKTKAGREKGWSKEKIREGIKSEQVWIREFQTSYLKDILGESKFKEAEIGPSNEEWSGMVSDLKNRISQKDWHNVIPRAGHMHNFEPEKFNEDVLPLFTDKDKEGILNEIEILRKGNPDDEKERRRKCDPWELASRIRYVSEFLPELKSRIEIDKKDWNNMKGHLDKARGKEYEEKDWETKGKKGDYWVASYQLCNMKIIEKMVKNGEIKALEK